MTKNNLKRYLLLSNGNQIDQKYTTLEDSDFVQKNYKLPDDYDSFYDPYKAEEHKSVEPLDYME